MSARLIWPLHHIQQARGIIQVHSRAQAAAASRDQPHRLTVTRAALADKRYVRSLPVDPYTKVADSWTPVQSDDPDHPGIKDVHSGAEDKAADGTPFASW